MALRQILKQEGVKGFYAGWRSGLAQKIPSYGLTWMFFQQLKRAHESLLDTKPSAETNFFLGALAAAGGTTVMIPMDTVKTRLVIQGATNGASATAAAAPAAGATFWGGLHRCAQLFRSNTGKKKESGPSTGLCRPA